MFFVDKNNVVTNIGDWVLYDPLIKSSVYGNELISKLGQVIAYSDTDLLVDIKTTDGYCVYRRTSHIIKLTTEQATLKMLEK